MEFFFSAILDTPLSEDVCLFSKIPQIFAMIKHLVSHLTFEYLPVWLSLRAFSLQVPPCTQPMPVDVQEEEITILISREPGQGLGISIAGGKGSTPFRGEDEVRRNRLKDGRMITMHGSRQD